MTNKFYELVFCCGCRYYFEDAETLCLFLSLEYYQPYMLDKKGGYVWSGPEIETATKCGKLVLVWPDREAWEVRRESPVGVVRRVRKIVLDDPTSEDSRPQ
jgi:hypothetical protein